MNAKFSNQAFHVIFLFLYHRLNMEFTLSRVGGTVLLNNAYVIVGIILVINIVYVTFSTIRMILTLKGRRYLAAFVSTFEVIVYILGLSIVLDNLDGIQNIIAYAVGFALGIITGSIIEERLALGYITVNVISSNPTLNFTERLREEGYGVTSWTSSGMDGDRLAMQILVPRKREIRLYQLITEIDPRAFIVSYEPKHIQGGFWVKQVRKGNKMKNGEVRDQVLKDIVPTEKVMEDDEIVEEIIDEHIQIHPNAKARPQKPNIKPKI